MKKIFISHSSLDKEIVDIFIDKILILGLNLEVKDIACTSREDTGVKTGNDIREFIKDNITSADFVLFMISANYKQSEICLNEMGAAWATNRNVKPIVFPNVGFDSLGWLYNVKRGIKINDSAALDSLYEDISEVCNVKSRVSTWNKHKTEFLEYLKLNNCNIDLISNTIIEEVKEVEELDMLDYREIFDSNIAICLQSLATIRTSMHRTTEYTHKSSKQLNNVYENKNKSFSKIRPILLKLAYENNMLSDIFDKETPIIENSFISAMEASMKLKEMVSLDDENMVEEQKSIKSMMSEMEEYIQAVEDCKNSLIGEDDIKLDKTHTNSKKRLIACLDCHILILNKCIDKANDVLIYSF